MAKVEKGQATEVEPKIVEDIDACLLYVKTSHHRTNLVLYEMSYTNQRFVTHILGKYLLHRA